MPYTSTVYAHYMSGEFYYSGDTIIVNTSTQEYVIPDNPINPPDPFLPPDEPDEPDDTVPTVDPLHPNIPTVSSSYSVGTPKGELTVNGTGAAQYQLAIACPDGGGLNPQIALSYNSQSTGYGLAGCGFTVMGLSAITRGGKDLFHDGDIAGVTYTDNDNLFLDGKRLILKSGIKYQEGAIYCLEGDPYTKIIIHGNYSDNLTNIWFEVKTTDGKTYQYGNIGNNSNACIRYKNKGNKEHVSSWYLNRVDDVYGNYMLYQYTVSNLYAYISTITYGLNSNKSRGITNKVSFEYQSLGSDYQYFHIEDQTGRIDRCISAITTTCNGAVYRKYILSYDNTSDQSTVKYTRLTTIQEQNGAGESLKPIILSWNFLPAGTPSTYKIDVTTAERIDWMEEGEKSFFAVDLNGDGVSDIVRHGIVSTLGDPRLHVYVQKSEVRSNEIFYHEPILYTLPNSVGWGGFEIKQDYTSAMDLDGDGYNDLIFPYHHQSFNELNQEFFCIILGNDIAKRNIDWYESKPITLQVTSQTPLYVGFDIDGDGKAEMVCIEKGLKDGRCVGFIAEWNDAKDFDYVSFSLSLPKDPQKMFSGDYNNDGLSDIILLYEDGYKIFFNNGGTDAAHLFSDTNSKTGISIKNFYRMQQGDFDGDGLVDFFYNDSSNETVEGYLQVSKNNGDGTFTHMTSVYVDVWDQTTKRDDHRFSLNVCDIDHDGKSDVMVSKAIYDHIENWGGIEDYWKFTKTRVRWLCSDGRTLKIVNSVEKDLYEDADERYVFLGDFDGDGYVEVANYGSNLCSFNNGFTEDKINVYRCPSGMQQGRIARIVDGMGNSTDITYASATNPAVYSKTPITDTDNTYPINTYTAAIPVVRSVQKSNGVAGSQTTEYAYKDLQVHVRGGGMLGFRETIVTNTATGEKNISTIEKRDPTRLIPTETLMTTTRGGKTSKTEAVYSVANVGRTYFAYVSSQKVTDIDGNITNTTSDYHLNVGALHSQTVSDDGGKLYKKVTYPGYVEASGIQLPRSMEMEQKHVNDANRYLSETRYSYDSKGNVIEVIRNYNTNMELITTSTYDDYGNTLTSITEGNGVTAIRKHCDYDPSGRFVIKKYQEPAAAVNTYTYDIWGNVLTESDETEPSNILTTRHTYDNWGNLTSSQSPDGTKTETVTGWGENQRKKYYILEKKSETPWVLTWYDNVGHEVLQETFGPKNVLISKATEYDYKDEVEKITSINGRLSTNETFTYDDLGRMTLDKLSSGKETTYTYGNRSVTTTTAGRRTSRTTDAWGNVKTSSDAFGNTVNYTYNSNGKPSCVSALGSTVTMEYDAAGNQISLTDPDAGTMIYEYAADGTLLKQIDARGVETVNTYDALGRLTKVQIGDNTINYTYGTSGNNKLRLIKKEMGGNSVEYKDFDIYGRPLTEVRNVSGKGSYTFRYEYDKRNRLTKTTYPGNLEVEYQYDDYGYKTECNADGNTIYSLKSYDGLTTETAFLNTVFTQRTKDANGYEKYAEMSAMPKYEKIDIGIGKNSIFDPTQASVNGIVSEISIGDKGKVIDLFKNVVDSHATNYDPLTDNLLARRRFGGSVEVFGYDELDRLTSVSTSTATTVTGTGVLTEVMNITYASNGNILSKTGVGEYTYNDQFKPHAVISVDNTDGLMSTARLNTTFNDLGKIQTIGDAGQYRNMDFVYGPDQQRWYSVMTKHGAVEREIVYAGDYEKVTEGGITREFYYLDGGAIIVKQNGEFKPYQAFTDNLGSILSVVDEKGEKVFEASYDAWGKQTKNLKYTNMLNLHRGYTGHEMLNEFGIINMNGRLYDPVLGRFFSPDNYVQAPNNSQNFNRYSYCLNNPLKYTDPSGEFFFGTIINGVKDFFVNTFVNVWTQGINAWTNADNWHSTYMSWKIDTGWFRGTPIQILSRFTWEYPQTCLGHYIATLKNTFYGVKSVSNYDGATAVETYGNDWGAYTLGSYIIGNRGLHADPDNTFFQHEYGHYLQSQSFGLFYLQRFALPSLFDTIIRKEHNNHPVEQDANIRAFKYFHEHEEGYAIRTDNNYNNKGWDMSENKILGYKSYLDYNNSANQTALNNTIGLGWLDYVLGPSVVFLGIIDSILLYQ